MAISGNQATVKSRIMALAKDPKGELWKNKGSIGTAAFHGIGISKGVNHRVQQGSSLSGALAQELTQSAMFAMNPGAMSLAYAAPVIHAGLDAAYTHRRQKAEELLAFDNPSQRIGGNYMDTQRAQTMRQAAVQQIQGNKLNARSALGGEARIFSNRHIT